MRSITSFELRERATRIDQILASFEWRIPDSSTELTSSEWQQVVRLQPAQGPLAAQESALRSQRIAEHEIHASVDLNGATELLHAQQVATQAQKEAIREDRNYIAHTASSEEDTSETLAALNTFQRIATRQARYIFDQIAEDDQDYAYLTFRYPVYDRRTQTWGTVHYEDGHHRAVIRLRNAKPDRLKRATERLVENLVAGDPQARKRLRLSGLWRLACRAGHSIWFEGAAKRDLPIVFDHVRVLEPGNSNEAFTGIVVIERSIESVLHERRGDLKVAGFLLFLGLITLVIESPWVMNLDLRLHGEAVWQDGWLAWFAGNLGRLGSALFVAVFLPVIQVWLHWREVVRRPSITWSAD